MSVAKLPCKYGASCYRRNPTHFEQFVHPPELMAQIDKNSQSASESSSSSSQGRHLDEKDTKSLFPKKRMKVEEDNSTSAEASFISSKPERFGFYLTKVTGIDDKFNRLVSGQSVASIGIHDILNEATGRLVESAQFNYMFEVDWLVKQYPLSWRKCPLHLVHGVKANGRSDLEDQTRSFSQVVLCPVKIYDPYGTHHTKMMILHFEEGLRIVIHTANMISGDWHQKTQGVWISPIFLRMKPSSAENCETNFKADLVKYLKNYRTPQIEKWINLIQQYDFASANVFLIASVPGKHKDANRHSYGHLKLRKVLGGKFGPSQRSENWPVISQFSSIGSLGPEPSKWLTSQFLSSLAKSHTEQLSLVKPDIKCIFPTVENVRTSLEGYVAGGSLPYSSRVASKQTYLKKYFHQWKASTSGRTEASPHIKTYCRLSPDCDEISWFLLTSANLSKAAWGELQIQGSQLAIRSFELGVLFLPKLLCNADHFSIKPSEQNSERYFPLPYDTPLMAYSSGDEEWNWDKFYVEAPDRHGKIWTPEMP